MPRIRENLDLEDLIIAIYTAMDDALKEAGRGARNGKLVSRPGPAPEVDDREVLCLAMLQEILGFESDHAFYSWLEANVFMRKLFPRLLTRQNWADRRALLTPLMQSLCQAFISLDSEDPPPFSSSTPILLTCAVL